MNSNREAVLAVRNVSKTYSSGSIGTRALDDVSMEVRRGEVVFLVGPSGSGKTTLLSIMGCLLRPSSGQVLVGGEDVTGWGEKRLPEVRLNQIGFVFQAFNLFPNLTAGENIQLTLDLKGLRGAAARRRAAELLEMVGLSRQIGSFPADLSGGQKQRVAIARALAADPAVILADEPTAALDSQSGAVVIQLLCELAHARHRAVVVVTHDSRIMEHADRVVHIEDGRIAEAAVATLHGETRI
ncbi:MAG TPA: ABC transporter ATP-binding protein [Bryobacteraceae bacterium]|jgi:putative ABC transport system ATP-binding protein|nr:ABC transporter ATP-binding protein [Bryobacteraceae bacterium]